MKLSMDLRANFRVKVALVICLLSTQTNLLHGKTYEEDLTLTLLEKHQLDKFKELVESRLPHDYMKKDVYLIRWLRSRYFNVKDAETMLMKNLKWRKENGMDMIQNEDWSYFEKEYPYSLQGRAKDGKPLLYVNVGHMDLRQAVVTGQREHFNRYIFKALDEACGLVRQLGETYQNVSQGILILDATGFNLIQHGCLRCLTVLFITISTYENYFPGCADMLFIINVPTIAEFIIEPAKAALHPETVKILKIYGTNQKTWREEILKYFDLDELPPEMGGKKMYKGIDDLFYGNY